MTATPLIDVVAATPVMVALAYHPAEPGTPTLYRLAVAPLGRYSPPVDLVAGDPLGVDELVAIGLAGPPGPVWSVIEGDTPQERATVPFLGVVDTVATERLALLRVAKAEGLAAPWVGLDTRIAALEADLARYAADAADRAAATAAAHVAMAVSRPPVPGVWP